jgi:hypothetical protein
MIWVALWLDLDTRLILKPIGLYLDTEQNFPSFATTIELGNCLNPLCYPLGYLFSRFAGYFCFDA